MRPGFRTRLAAWGTIAVLGLSACGNDDPPRPDPPGPSTTTTEPTTEPTSPLVPTVDEEPLPVDGPLETLRITPEVSGPGQQAGAVFATPTGEVYLLGIESDGDGSRVVLSGPRFDESPPGWEERRDDTSVWYYSAPLDEQSVRLAVFVRGSDLVFGIDDGSGETTALASRRSGGNPVEVAVVGSCDEGGRPLVTFPAIDFTTIDGDVGLFGNPDVLASLPGMAPSSSERGATPPFGIECAI